MEEVRRAYGAIAAQYIELFGNRAQVDADDLALIARHLAKPGAVLDVGCGPGHLTAYLQSLGADAVGLDLVPELVDHARIAHPEGRYELASMDRLPVRDGSLAGILAWYSLIHLPPDRVDAVLDELRRAMAPDGALVAGFFDGAAVEAFAHKVVTAHFWPIDEMAARLERAGFTVVERQQRASAGEAGPRAHAALAAIAH